MLEKEFRNEDPPIKIIALISLVMSLVGGGAFAVKLGLQGFPPLKMALFRCILGLISVGGIGLYYGMSMRMRFEELPRLLLIAGLHAAHIITLNIGTQLTTARMDVGKQYRIALPRMDCHGLLLFGIDIRAKKIQGK